METLNEGFGRLSTSAAEWKPSITSSSVADSSITDINTIQSDLSASGVKEFCPGQAWSASASTAGKSL